MIDEISVFHSISERQGVASSQLIPSAAEFDVIFGRRSEQA